MDTKICKLCGVEKNINEYRITLCKKNGKTYIRGKCKQCESKLNSQRNKKSYLENKEKFSKRSKEYYEKNKNNENFKNKRQEYSKKYREDNKEKLSIKRKKYYRENIKKEREYKKEYYYTHQEERKERDKKYYLANKVKMLEKQKEKRKNDSKYKIKKQTRSMLWNSFKRNGHTKSEKSEKILGCNLEFFYDYLLETFKNNYGYEWDKIEPVHIDHIIPLATATTEEEVIKLCNYSNLQLLKAKDNLEKSNKINWEKN